MPLVKAAYEYYKKAMKEGKGELHTGHPFISEEEQKKRERNEPNEITNREKTKIAFDSCDPDSYREWHKERSRRMKLAGNDPTLCTDGMIVTLRLETDEQIKMTYVTLGQIRADLETQRALAAGIPPAQIPPATS